MEKNDSPFSFGNLYLRLHFTVSYCVFTKVEKFLLEIIPPHCTMRVGPISCVQ